MVTGRIIEQDRTQKPLKDVFYYRKTARASFASRRFINERPKPAKFQEATRLINFTFFATKYKSPSRTEGGSRKERLLTIIRRSKQAFDPATTKPEPAKFSEDQTRAIPPDEEKTVTGTKHPLDKHVQVVHRTRPDTESDINTGPQHGLRADRF
ncbi:hypothetical protein TKK_0012268 [Trichogramma kaykai]